MNRRDFISSVIRASVGTAMVPAIPSVLAATASADVSIGSLVTEMVVDDACLIDQFCVAFDKAMDFRTSQAFLTGNGPTPEELAMLDYSDLDDEDYP
jgi:hypothetical protein